MSEERLVFRIIVRGRVQGVGFRAFVARAAATLALAGWARNCDDGAVEIVAAGPRDALDALVEAARRGPAFARVDDLRREEASEAALVERRGDVEF
ncbi:acylphosphatase [Methylosinus sp. H3A]|uniref:acylphosphatase n=1 Tax=Methylosinus sp. H3A TaxID=2785786 RepID=UPI0018C247CA|nr:acylphosphatase [Methylosinus sp. H3A]MBG0808747.1 acylphosphatase [Methylosinus sp. H3A]